MLKKLTDGYDKLTDKATFMTGSFYERAIKLEEDYSGKAILDVGCGKGLLLERVIFKQSNVAVTVGLELSEKLAKYAHKRCRSADIILGDAANLPFRDDAFNIVFCTEVIEHLLYPHQTLKEIYRTTQKRGFLIITCPNVVSYYPFYWLARYLPRSSVFYQLFTPMEVVGKSSQPIDNVVTFRWLTKLLAEHYFNIIRQSGLEYVPWLIKINALGKILLRLNIYPLAYRYFVKAQKS